MVLGDFEASVVFEDAHPFEEWGHHDITERYFTTEEIWSFKVNQELRDILQQLRLTSLLYLLFLVEQHGMKTPFHGGLHEELAVKVHIRLGVIVWRRVEVLVLTKCLVNVLDAVSFSTDDLVPMFDSRNLNLFIAPVLLLSFLSLLLILLRPSAYNLHLQVLGLPLQVDRNLHSLHLWEVRPV